MDTSKKFWQLRRFCPHKLKNVSLKLRKRRKKTFQKKLFSPKCSLGTQIVLLTTLPKRFRGKADNFQSRYENTWKSSVFPEELTVLFGHAKCNSYYPAGNFLPEVQTFFFECTKTIKNTFSSKKFCSNCSCANVECSFDKAVKMF